MQSIGIEGSAWLMTTWSAEPAGSIDLADGWSAFGRRKPLGEP